MSENKLYIQFKKYSVEKNEHTESIMDHVVMCNFNLLHHLCSAPPVHFF